MRGRIAIVVMLAVIAACSKDEIHSERGIDYAYGKDIPHDRIVLGNRLENPYKTENMEKALASLYPSKADRVEIKSTDLYVRFLPKDESEFKILENLGIPLLDHPMDYDIEVDGDWYHDESLPEGGYTWQYSVVPVDFEFPDIRYEIIDECYMSENDPVTRSLDDGIDWAEVEREAYVLTGNADRIIQPETRSGTKVKPSGRITIVDEDANGGKPFGVAGVRVSCNSFIKWDHAYCDRDGYYSMSKEFSTKLRYRLVFKNEKNFSIGFNMILVPASVSTLGKAEPTGVNMTVTSESDQKLFRRCVVNNAAYDYYSRCQKEDLDILPPPADLRIWIFGNIKSSSAPMFHHGTFADNAYVDKLLGPAAEVLESFLPDVILGVKEQDDYRSIYSETSHELAHTSHFAQAGLSYWSKFVGYIMKSFLTAGGSFYGDGAAEDAGYCSVGESWAYFLESKIYKDRYGGPFPSFGTSYWFSPQIFRYLYERGFDTSDLFKVLDSSVKSREELKYALISEYPHKREIIEQVFNRY